MDLNEILIFARVVQAQSFTVGARLLGMPKSSVSRKVADLENRLGARLLQRTTRKLALTDIGRIYYEHCARIVGEVEEAEQAVGRMQVAPCGPLRVTAPLGFSMLGPIIAEFVRRYPQVQVELVCTDRLVSLIDEGFDVAIRAGALSDSSLYARSLGAIERVLLAAPEYLRQKGTPLSPIDLEKHLCISFAAGTAPNSWTLYALDRQVEVRILSRLSINDYAVIREAVCSGIGIAWMPSFMCAAELRAGKLCQILPDWSSAQVPVHALYPSTRHLSPKVLAFVELLRERLILHESPSIA